MKKNKKGFTLVELIVVMCLMGIIMAAVMALVTPTSNYYYKVQTTKDQENCALSVGKAINNELQYALAVEVYSSDTASVTPTDPSKFTNYIKIDNVTPRSNSKKHAPGIAYKGTTATGSETAVMGDAAYDENAYKITLSEYSNQKGSNFIMLDFESNPMKYESGSYVKNTDVKYNYSQSINFTNINSTMTMGVSHSDSISVSYDASKTDYIYIFYLPAQNGATATTTTTSLTTTTTTTPTTTTASDDSGSTTTTTTTSESTPTTTTTSTSTTTLAPSDVPGDFSLVSVSKEMAWWGNVRYTIKIKNNGSDSSAWQIKFKLPDGATFNQADYRLSETSKDGVATITGINPQHPDNPYIIEGGTTAEITLIYTISGLDNNINNAPDITDVSVS